MALTQRETEQLEAVGRELDRYGEAMTESEFDGAVEQYHALLAKRDAPPEPDIPFLSIRRPGDIRPVTQS